MVKELPATRYPLSGLDGGLSALIRGNAGDIENVLARADAQRLRGLGDTKETMTVQESLETYNKGISEDEIRAWVYYKRSIGVPMRGWEKYFLKDSGSGAELLVTLEETEICDERGKSVKIVPAGSQLGAATKTATTPGGWVRFTDKAGVVRVVKESAVKRVISNYRAAQKDIDKMVRDGVLFYNKGRYLPYAVFVYANSYDRELELLSDRDFIVERYGEEVYKNHEQTIKNTRPKQLSFIDPIESNRPQVSPLSDFAEDFIIGELEESSPIYEDSKREVPLSQSYRHWLWEIRGESKYFTYSNINGASIVRVYMQDERRPRGMDEKGWTLYKGRCKKEGERLFSVFIQENLTTQDKTRLDWEWNRLFNGFPHLQHHKVPIGLEMSRIVRGAQFDLRPAQREGVAFIELANSGCISYDVGVGKTFTAIAELGCALSQGRCARPLIVVPNSTYKNWVMELFGDEKNNGLLSHTGIAFNDWYNLGTQMNISETSIQNNSITLVTYEGFKKMGFTTNVAKETADEMERILLQTAQNTQGKQSARIYKKIEEAIGRGNKDSRVDFDKCGFDYIVIDEAHRCKNIFSKVQADGKKGVGFHQQSGEPSSTGLKAFIFCNYVQRKFGGNIMLLTATPFSNSPLEIYSMLSLVGMDNLRARNVDNINTFFDTFVNEEFAEVVTAALTIDYAYITRSFKNRIILQDLIYSNFNYKTGEEAGVKRPTKINFPLVNLDGKRLPPKDQILTYLSMTSRQESNQEDINQKIDEVINGNGVKANSGDLLRGLADSLNNAFSPFLYEDETPSDYKEFVDESPKIKYACDCVKAVKEWHENRGEECSGQIIYSDRGKEFFGYIKEYLENECGFKKGQRAKKGLGAKGRVFDEVELLVGGSADDKDEIMDAFNSGVIKVIIGTSTMREGVNLQKRSTCLYNLYPEWNPTNIQQLEGRLWRQGNKFQFVRIALPLVQNSMDTFIFQKLQEKTDRINDIWYRADRGNVLNVDSLDPEEVKYALITDIAMLTKNRIGKDIIKAEREKKLLDDEIDAISGFGLLRDQWSGHRFYLWNSMSGVIMRMEQADPIRKRPTSDEMEEYPQTKRDHIIGILETYDETKAFLGKDFYDHSDKEILAASQKLIRAASHCSGYIDTIPLVRLRDRFRDTVKELKKSEDSVLAKRGFDRNSDLEQVTAEMKKEQEAKEREIEYLKSADNFNQIYEEIAEAKRSMNIVGKTIEERINEFGRTDYVMKFPFNPGFEMRNNELPDPNLEIVTEKPTAATRPATPTEDRKRKMRRLEMEAVAMRLLLVMKKKSRK